MENDILKEVSYWPYERKEYFFSVAELKFYEVLKAVIGDKYLIFPKVRICDLIKTKEKEEYLYFNKIKSKHVDFVICEKQPIRTKIIIELDDSSHYRAERQERDNFIDEAFANAGIPIVHIPVKREYRKEELSKQLNDAYQTKYLIKKPETEETILERIIKWIIGVVKTIFRN